MKTAVLFKWSKDPQDAIVSKDGEVSWRGVKPSASDDDPAAMDIAKKLSEENEIVGVTIEGGKTDWAAARDASSTVVIENIPEDADSNNIADALVQGIKQIDNLDAVIVGDSDWNRAVVTALIGKLGWKAFTGVIDAEIKDSEVTVTVKSPKGSKIISIDTPVLIAAQGMSQEENVPGMKQTLAARKKPVEKIAYENTNESQSKSLGTKLPEGDSVVLFDDEDPQEAVSKLIEALNTEGVL